MTYTHGRTETFGFNSEHICAAAHESPLPLLYRNDLLQVRFHGVGDVGGRLHWPEPNPFPAKRHVTSFTRRLTFLQNSDTCLCPGLHECVRGAKNRRSKVSPCITGVASMPDWPSLVSYLVAHLLWTRQATKRCAPLPKS